MNKTKLSVWTNWDDKKVVEESLNKIKDKIKKHRITQNKDGVWILWVDRESATKHSTDKFRR